MQGVGGHYLHVHMKMAHMRNPSPPLSQRYLGISSRNVDIHECQPEVNQAVINYDRIICLKIPLIAILDFPCAGVHARFFSN